MIVKIIFMEPFSFLKTSTSISEKKKEAYFKILIIIASLSHFKFIIVRACICACRSCVCSIKTKK